MRSRFAVIGMAFAAVGTIALGASQASADGYSSGPRYVAPFSWTGFYIGVNGGGAWLDKDWHVPNTAFNIAGGCPGCPTTAGGHSGQGGLVGGQVGFNLQVDRSWVLGVELQDDWGRIRASGTNTFIGAPFRDNSEISSVGTIAARLGLAHGRSLFYVKGGGAWAEDKFWVSPASGVVSQVTSDTRWGWMGGVGVEYASHGNLSVKLEYDRMDFGRDRERLACIPGTGCAVGFEYDIRQTIDLVKVGINYKFGRDEPRPLK